MKKEITFDKYGYRLKNIRQRNFDYNRYFIDVEFLSSDNNIDTVTIKQYSRNLISALITTRKIKKELQGKNIIECISFLIIDKYQFATYFSHNFYNFLSSIPEDLLMNDEAIKELLNSLPEHNKELYIEVANYIKNKREMIQRQNDLKKADNEMLDQMKSGLQKDLGL